MMHKNKIFLTFLSAAVILMLWSLTASLPDLRNYFTLRESKVVNFLSSRVVQIKANRFALMADVAYVKETVSAQAEVQVGIYPNELAASLGAAALKKKPPTSIWYTALNHLVIEKKFPWRSSCITLLLIALVSYLFILGMWIPKIKGLTE